MAKTKGFNVNAECLDDYDVDEDGFIDGDVAAGVPIVTFSFGEKTMALIPQTAANTSAASFAFGAGTMRFFQRGSTPAVNGEAYTIKRCYKYRKATMRKLNELKAKNSEVNVYLNTIIDEAINHYYDYVFNSTNQLVN